MQPGAGRLVEHQPGQPITSASSSDTDMTGCSTVLLVGGAACQCYVINPAPPYISYYKQNKLYKVVYDDSRQLEWGSLVTSILLTY